jgi:hypothetical protein
MAQTWGLAAQFLCYTDATTRIFRIHAELNEIQPESAECGKMCPFLEMCHVLNIYENGCKDLINIFLKSSRNKNEKQGIDALEQLYGYMTSNNTKYGVLTNWMRAWFFRRMEEGDRKYWNVPAPSSYMALCSLRLCSRRLLASRCSQSATGSTSRLPQTPPLRIVLLGPVRML